MSSAHLANKGIILLEVLLAFAILSISLGVFLQTTGSSLNRHRVADNQIEAVSVAANLLADFDLSKFSGNQLEGKFDDTYSWRVSVQPVSMLGVDSERKESKLMLVAISLDILWGDKGREKVYRVNTKRMARRAVR